jgi:MFS superfamily sulfate permease-like transporter
MNRVTPREIGGDFAASLVVFLVALPLCMGIAIASGVPPALGIATGVIGGLIVGAISGSPLQVSGPAAGLAVIVFELVRDFGLPMLGPVLLMAGLIQFVAGRLKLGQWFRAISPAVVYGMLAGIGVLIVVAQFHVMVDDKPKSDGLSNLMAIPQAIWKVFFPAEGTSHHVAAAVGVLTLACILVWNRFRPERLKLLPGTLIGVVVATAITAAMGLPVNHVQIPANIWSVFSLPTTDSFKPLLTPGPLLAAFGVALVASAETLLSAAAVDRLHNGPRTDYDKELSAQGIGNMLCGLIGALPMTGVIVRSSANVQAGAKTRLAAVLHSVWILAFVLLLPSVLRMIPTSCLAAVLVFTGFKLIDSEHVRKLAGYDKMLLWIYAATLIGIVTVDLLTGVLTGVALSVVKLVWKATQLKVRVELDASKQCADVHLEGLATFIRLPKLAKALDEIPAEYTVHLHSGRLYYIDHVCLDLVDAAVSQRTGRGGSLEVHWDELTRRYKLPDMADSAARPAA